MAPGVPSCSSSFIQSRRGARGVLAYRVLCVGLLVVMKWTRPLCGPAAMSQNDFKTSESIEPQEASPMKKLSVIGIDIAKQVFHLVGMDEQGTILVRKRLYRAQVMAFIAQLPPMLIGMEACGGAHYWARRFREHGHEVKLMAPQFVKPYVKTNKNDMR